MGKKVIVLPLVIMVLFLAFYYMQNLKEETAVPDREWGRSASLGIKSSYPANQYVYSEGSTTHIYMQNKHDVTHVKVQQKDLTTERDSIPVSTDVDSPIWAKDSYLAYLQGEDLKTNDGRIIDQEVTSFSSNKDSILYWKKGEAYEVKPEKGDDKWERKLIFKTKGKILKAEKSKNGQAIMIAAKNEQGDLQFNYLHNGQIVKQWIHTLYGSENYESFSFDASEDRAFLILETTTLAQGVKAYRAHTLEFNPHSKEDTKPTKLMIMDSKHNVNLKNPRYMQVRYQDGQPTILFTAEGNTVGKRFGNNVYEAKNSNDVWVAERRSTTESSALKPIWTDNKSIIWQTFNGKHFEGYGTAKQSLFVEKSLVRSADDYKAATYHTISGMFGSILFLLIGIICVVPPMIFYTIVYFVNSTPFEQRKTTWVEPVAILSYLLTQIYVMNELFSDKKLSFAPSYLSFEGGLIIWPILLSVLTYLIYKLSTSKDTGPFIGLTYYIGINLLFMTCLFGPYLL